jgi:hypothetical protein
MELVKIVCFNSSPKFATTVQGEQVGRSTLYRMPKKARIANIFAKRNEAYYKRAELIQDSAYN